MGEGIRKILIVEKDSSLLSFLKERLTAMGYEAHCAEEIPAGILTGIVVRPDIIIYNRAVDQGGVSFREEISRVSQLSGIPLVPYDFSAEDDQDPGERIRKGLLLDSISSELRGRGGLSPATKSEHRAQETRIPEILELLAKTGRSGRLRIHGDNQESGEIYLDHGKIKGAKTDDLEGSEAFFALLDLESVGVEFEEGFPATRQFDPPVALSLLLKNRGRIDAPAERVSASNAPFERDERDCLDRLISLGFLKKLRSKDHG
ncbi:MAG TPA: DUF4388 domain-containing protein [Nitrospiria bacterium]|nr:DUF4388 domain-containing protein [Nitrospiria bacterium]